MDQGSRVDLARANRLRVLLVAPAPPPYGGMALQARQLERLLRGDGHSVVLLPSNFSFPRRLGMIERLPGVRTAMRALMIWPKLWSQVSRADIVHVLAASWLYFFLVVWPAVAVARFCRKRLILNYRGGAADAFFRAYGWAVRPALALADAVTAPSEFLATHIRKHFGIAVSIVPNLISSNAFPFRRRTTVRPAMLVTRHLEDIYGVDTVLRAFAAVQKRYPDASLWIAGSGSQEGMLREQIVEQGLANVRLLGDVPHNELGAIYDQRDILLNASRVDNFPGALLEASAAGLIVVSTDAGGIPYIYQHGTSALLVGVDDWEGLAREVIDLLDLPSMGQKLAEAALPLARACEWHEVRHYLYRSYGLTAEEAETAPGTAERQQSCPLPG